MARRNGTGGSIADAAAIATSSGPDRDRVMVKTAERYAKRVAAAARKGDGTVPTLEGLVAPALFDDPGTDAWIESLDLDLKEAVGPGHWHGFAARLQDMAAVHSQDGGTAHAFAVPLVGPAHALAGLLGDVDGIAALMGSLARRAVFGPGTRIVAAPFSCSPIGLACAPPGALRRFVIEATDMALEGEDDAVARALSTFNGMSILDHREQADALPSHALSTRALVGVCVSAQGTLDPDALDGWHEAMRLAFVDAGIEVGTPALPSAAARDLATMRVEHIVSRQAGRHGLGPRAKPIRSLILQDGRSFRVAFDHGRGILVGPVDVPVRVAAADKDHFHDLVQRFSGGEAVVFDDADAFDGAIDAVRPSTIPARADAPARARARITPPSFPKSAPAVEQPRPAAPVVDLAARREARAAERR